MSYLDELESKSIYIIREAKANYKNIGVPFSTGKDSTTMLALIRKAFFGEVPFPVIHIDTEKKFKEIYEFRDMITKKWDLDLIVEKNKDALEKGISPETVTKFECCNKLKTGAFKQVLKKYKFDALIMSIRRDEHFTRNVEHYSSPRDKNFKWHLLRPKTKEELKKGDAPFISEQPVELGGWDLYQSDFGLDIDHVRIHPLLDWTEINIWEFIKKEKLPVNPLYFANYVEKKYGLKNRRFRSLGCQCCTNPVVSNAKTIDEIIEELKTTDIEERSGRAQDKEQVLRRLRSLGYF